MTISTSVSDTLKIFTVTYPDTRNIAAEANTYLPLSEPSTAQVSFTVQSGDIPVFSPPIESFVNLGVIYGLTRNDTGSTATIYRTAYVNGSPMASGNTSVTNGQKHTMWYKGYNLQVGDVIEIKLWSSIANVLYVGSGIGIVPSRICPESNIIMQNFYMTLVNKLSFSLPGYTNYGGSEYWKPVSGELAMRETHTVFTLNTKAWECKNMIVQQYYGDVSGANATGASVTSGTYVCVNQNYKVPTLIKYNKIEENKG